MQRYAIWNGPEKCEANHTWLTWNWIRAAGTGKDSVRVEKNTIPEKKQRSRKVTGREDCSNAWDLVRQDRSMNFRQEAELSARRISAFEPFFVRSTDYDWALKSPRPVRPG